MQLPFLQSVLGEFSLVPLAVGDASVAEVAGVIERLWGGEETLFVLSTDLSHYHSYQEARRIDGATAGAHRLARERPEPRAGLRRDAAQRPAAGRARQRPCDQAARCCNSGDTAGDRGRVVGYSSFAFYEPGAAASRDEQGRTLLGIARGAIGSQLGQAAAPRLDHPAWLAQPGASFVTLTIDGELRGCIGSLQAHRPLGEDVAANAETAAFRDPRFAPLALQEWPRVAAEVSLLSAPEKAEFGDEIDLLARLRPGVDGVILEYGGRRGTFLPQVWESLRDRRRFMRSSSARRDLPRTRRSSQCSIWRYQVEKWREAEFAD